MRKKIELMRVQYMPKDLKPGVLYVSEEFGAAAHLCACGCGAKIRTPLSPTDWSLEVSPAGPSLYPSIGNWQQECKSHYWIRGGEFVWAIEWTSDQIAVGRAEETRRAEAYYEARSTPPQHWTLRLWQWIKMLFGVSD